MRPDKIVLASNNAGKVKEINEVLANLDIDVIPQSEFDVDEVEETGASFVENALIKARHASKLTTLPAIADDSGIEVSALGGQPGIYSARYAGVGASDEDNLQKLITNIQDYPEEKRTARYVCVMVYLRHANDPVPIISQGFWEGRLLTEPAGSNGFGYDPIFYLDEQQCTSAELTAETKNALSHRGKALRQLVSTLTETYR